MSTPHTDRADDLAERHADEARRWEARLPPLPDRSEWFDPPRRLPPPQRCWRCGQPTPDMAARMAHDDSCNSRSWQDTY